ncbi:MAG: choice-of-anchor D domain-containing protein [Phycisphaera sp.]|nr:choice-of-anchor D domain-containing protein [Phycisphaera sp.]
MAIKPRTTQYRRGDLCTGLMNCFFESLWTPRASEVSRDPQHGPSLFEPLEARLLLSADPNDQISEAIQATVNSFVTGTISAQNTNPDPGTDFDVDMYKFNVTAGHTLGFDIDDVGDLLDSYLRLFDSTGSLLGNSDDGKAPDDLINYYSLESYLTHTFDIGGTYYIGVSGFGNGAYKAVDGSGDQSGDTGGYRLTITDLSVGFDFGNAPDTYGTSLASNGPRHAQSGLRLGTTIDAEADGAPSGAALGDNNTGTNDEDGVTFLTALRGGDMATVRVNSSGIAFLNAWIDFNADGDFNDAGEQIFDGRGVNSGNNDLQFSVPDIVTTGSTFARFRLSSLNGLEPTGVAPDGEVEDYQVYTQFGGEIEVRGNGFEIVDGDQTPNALDFTHFGTLLQNGGTLSRTFTVNNVGTAPITTSNLTVPEGFTVIAGLDAIIPAGGSDTFTVQMQVDTLGTAAGDISFTNNDANENPYNFAITGTVAAAGAIPGHLWSTYVGDYGTEYGNDTAVDANGNVYIVGYTSSDNWAVGGYDTSYGGVVDGYVAKYAPNGELLWSTYLGGDGDEVAFGLAVKGSSLYVSGYTESAGWTSGGPDTSYNGGADDIYVVKLATNGQFIWSTYLGGAGDDYGTGLSVAGDGSVYLTGQTDSTGWVSGGYDTTQNGGPDAFVVKLNANGQTLWSTYLGGESSDTGYDIGVAGDGSVYVSGYTSSAGWASGGYDTIYNFGQDAFIVKLNASGQHLWSTYVGGSEDDFGNNLAIAGDGSVYLAGETHSAGWVSGGYNTDFTGTVNGFVVKVNANGQHLWSTYLGGDDEDRAFGVALTGTGGIYVVGRTASYNGWISGGYDTQYSSNQDGFVVRLDDINLDYGDAPDSYGTTKAADGARHYPTGLTLGASRDAESNGLVSGAALGDDNGNTDDENGVTFLSDVRGGATTTVRVNTSAPGFLNAWIDYNGDGDFGDAGEQVFIDKPVYGGNIDLTFVVPNTLGYTSTFARFRLTSFTGVGPTGYARDGEVEDYQVYTQAGPDALVQGNNQTIVTGDTSPSELKHTDFGTLYQNGGTISRTFTVFNNGTVNLTTSNLTVPAGFTITEGLNATITPGGSDTFTVRMDVATLGVKSGFVSFNTTDTDANPYRFTITGTVAAAQDVIGHLWSSYVGGTASDSGNSVAVASDGSVYITGQTSSSGWVSGGYDNTLDGSGDAFVVKFSPSGQHQWSTYLGGTGNDSGNSVAVAPDGSVYVTGTTASSGWVSGGDDTSQNGGTDGFVVKLNAAGQHQWSTYLGGTSNDYGNSVAVDPDGSVYVTGETFSTGWVSGGYDTSQNGSADGFVVKLNAAGQHLWSTYLGGTEYDYGFSVAVAPDGSVYVTGQTFSSGWVSGGYDIDYGGGADGFVVKLNAAGQHLWSTYLGGTATDNGNSVAVATDGSVYVTGSTYSSGWVSGGYDTSQNGDADGFVVKLNTAGQYQWSTYLGGTGNDYGYFVAVAPDGSVYVAGETESSGWVSGGYDTSQNGSIDAFLVRLSNTALDYGDAPNSYHTLLASDGARHYPSSLYLGALIDYESDGQPTLYAGGDDNTGTNDENGVTFLSALRNGQNATVRVNASDFGYLNAWIDFNADGDFDDDGEQIITNQSLIPGNSDVVFTVTGDTLNGLTIARFRLSTVGDLSYTGYAPDGEVEDYSVFTISEPEVEVRGNNIVITDGDLTPATNDFTNFGTIYQNGQPLSKTFTVYNDGTADLNTSNLTVPAGYTVTEGLSATIPAGSADTFTVQLGVGSLGVKSGQISFVTNDSNENPYNFAITGTVAAAQTFIDYLWSSYVGGSALENGTAVAVDSQGNVYLAGATDSSDLASGGYDTSYGGGVDGFVAKYTAGGKLLWSTYLGADGVDYARAMAVAGDGSVYVAGYTQSTGWASGGYDTTYDGNQDGFVVKLNTNGGFLWSTYLGGFNSDTARGIAVTGNGSVYVTGETQSSGWVMGGDDTTFSGTVDAFVVRLNSSGQHVWSTYLGGDADDYAYAVAVAGNNNIYVTGYTTSTGWVSGGYDTSLAGGLDAFVVRLDADSHTIWSTYLGGDSVEVGNALAVTGDGSVYVAGYTQSSGWVSGGYDTTYGGDTDGFVVKLNSGGLHLWSTYLGGNSSEAANGLALAGDDGVYVAGETGTDGWVSGGHDTSFNGNQDGFAVRLGGGGQHLWSTYVGGTTLEYLAGLAVAADGSLYLVGHTYSDGWVNGGYDTTFDGSLDAYLVALTRADLDYGDAPDTYGTLLASEGARHYASSLYLGASIDTESNGLPTLYAGGDDNTGTDDENGVTFLSAVRGGNTATVRVNASGSGNLNAWIDFNNDGDFLDAGEQIITDQVVNTGNNDLGFSVPGYVINGPTFARFRLSSATGLAPTGYTYDGEVEDHLIYTQAGPTADFNGDGRDDIVFRNTSNGQNVVWYMNGSTKTGSAGLPPVADTHWQIVAVGDMNLDGSPDLVWRNSMNGQNLIWTMNGTTKLQSIGLPPVADLNWKIVGVGDFNSDFYRDIVWRNTATGQHLVWTMNGTAKLGNLALPTVADLNWQLAAIRDLDANNKPDLIWRNTSNGNNLVWLMNGTSVLSGVDLPNVGSMNWIIAGTLDSNYDAKPDILWRNTATGQTLVWTMNGTTRTGSLTLPTVASVWQAVV